MYERQKSIPLIKSAQKFLALCIMFSLVFLVSSCGGRGRYKQYVSNFSKNENRVSVILTFSEPQIDAKSVPGGVDVGSTVANTIVFGFISSLAAGPSRKGDIGFHEKINDLFISTILADDGYFVDHFLKKLSFSPNITPDFKVSSIESLRIEEQIGTIKPAEAYGENFRIEEYHDAIKPADAYVVIDLTLTMLGKSRREKERKTWSKKAYLEAQAVVWLIKDKETFHRFLNGEHKLKKLTYFCYIEDVPDVQSGQPNLVKVVGLFTYSKLSKKKKWLAENGQFFDQQLKFVLDWLALVINKRVLTVK